MESKESVTKPTERNRLGNGFKKRRGLQLRMTLSYVGVSVATALLLELLFIAILFLVIFRLPILQQSTSDNAQHIARIYALEATAHANGGQLDPRSTFQSGQPVSLVLPGASSTESVPYTATRSSSSQVVAFALLVAPNGQILASSYPARYPNSLSIARLLPKQAALIRGALAGKVGSMAVNTVQGPVVSVAQPVLNQQNKPIGAIYIQMPPVINNNSNFIPYVWFLLITGLFWLVLTSPIGAIFGILTTRGLVRRLHRLVKATGQFADGDYSQRVPMTRRDEIGQLEQQFNMMAEQLVESIAQQKTLVEQHTRQEERARIEQELHTARLIQLSLLPKEQPTLPGWRITTYYQAAREVGGDLYDFLPFEDGRLGLVIGDVTDKGMPAALMMASARSMLRAAALATDSPGEVLARVNDLLCVDIPEKMFVTCFYAILDPSSGKLRFANAGHDLPYCQHEGSVRELRATGMPLGLMPGIRYEEQEVILAHDENILFYTDGLVEAHNFEREMFGFPRLQSLLAGHSNGATLIDFLLAELLCFTGEEWEQEDDMTLLTLQRMP